MTPLTPSEQHEILRATHPKQLQEVIDNIDYLVEMVKQWMLGKVWSSKEKPATFELVCSLVLGDDPSIPKDLYGHTEESLSTLQWVCCTSPVRYQHETARIAVAWLWRELHGTLDTAYLPLPTDLLEPF